METILQVTPVDHEDGSYHVLSRTLFCSRCEDFSYQHKGLGLPKYNTGDACPKCAALLERRKWLTDVRLYDGLGRCGCQRWQFYLQPLVLKMSRPERLVVRECDEYRCPHLIAAMRVHALIHIDYSNLHQPQGEAE